MQSLLWTASNPFSKRVNFVYYISMIGQLTGIVYDRSGNTVIIDVNGTGYEVYVSENTKKVLVPNSPQTLLTYLAVRETALELYGFLTFREKDLFTKLINVPGIGPRSAIAILSLTNLETLIQAISKGDAAYLTTVSGIGKKSAEKIIIELRDKLSPLEDSGATSDFADLFDALVTLGYQPRDIRDALSRLPPHLTDTNDQIKAALKLLSQK